MDSAFGRPRSFVWIAVALFLGACAGWLDLGAHEVQGPLLVLLLASFVAALPGRAPAWSIGIATWLGLPLAHAIAALRGGEPPSAGMIIALPLALLVAYEGAFAGRLIGRAARSVPRDSLGDASGIWGHRPFDSATLLLAALVACALLGSVPVYGTLIARQQPIAWWVATSWQVMTFLGWVILLPLVLGFRRRVIGTHGGVITPLQLLWHAAFVLVGAALHAVLIVLLSRALFMPLGPAGFAAAIGWAFAAYLPIDALTYALVLLLASASDQDRHARLAREHAAALGAQLDRARLAALEAQLRPHFLFNALNAAVVLVRRGSADRAVTVLTGLADLMRYAMDNRDPLVPLDAELAFVRGYLGIEEVRLAERLRWRVVADAEAAGSLVPRLVLQPLVENAVRHGVAKQLRGGEIVVSARLEGERLCLTVDDDGAGLAESFVEGIGLTNTRARLETIYHGQATLALQPRAGGGSIAQVTIPRVSATRARSA